MISLKRDVITELLVVLTRSILPLSIHSYGRIEMSGNHNAELTDTKVSLSKSDLISHESDNHGQSALASMWKEAYEHPVRTGAIAAAAVVAGGAAIALATRRPGVLIIEDTPAMGMAMRDTLQAAGHKVTWVTHVSKLNPLTGIDAAGKEVAIAGNRKFKLALLDGDLGKDMMTGPEIVGSLRRENIVTLGTSTMADLNLAMKTNGAEMAATKPVVFTSLVAKQLDVRQALRAPAEVQASLDALSAAFRSKEIEPIRKAADAKLMEYFSKGV